MHSIGQSIKLPECPCVRPTFLKLFSFHLPLPFLFPSSFPSNFLPLQLPFPFPLSPFPFFFPFPLTFSIFFSFPYRFSLPFSLPFLRAKAECFARLSHRLGVCPSVRPSVTLVICIKTVQARITKSLLWAAPRSLVYRDKISCH